MGLVLVWLICKQKLHHHCARLYGPLTSGFDNHTIGGITTARGGKRALTINLNHASAAVTVRIIAHLVFVAKMRDFGAVAFCHVPNSFALRRGDFCPV